MIDVTEIPILAPKRLRRSGSSPAAETAAAGHRVPSNGCGAETGFGGITIARGPDCQLRSAASATRASSRAAARNVRWFEAQARQIGWCPFDGSRSIS